MKKTAKKQTATNAANEPKDSMLYEFFQDEIKDIYWAEKNILKALPKMKKAATSTELQNAFEEHRTQTEIQVQRLEQVFELMDKKAQAKKCDAMAGILEEATGIIDETEKGTATRDVGLILAAQKVEHYEISTYGGLAQLAEQLGLDEIKNLLGETLQEEKETDEKLTDIAKNSVNYEASKENES